MSLKCDRSITLYEHGSKFLAGGVSSNFRYTGYGESPVPLYFVKGKGSRITDADGNVYIDYALANGPVILGHAPAVVLDKVKQTLSLGQLFAGQTEMESQLAEKLVKLVPCAELVRFASSGTEAIQAAIRLARAFTGKTKILKFEGHYHGWTDNVFVSVHPSLRDAGDEMQPTSVAQSAGQSIRALDDIVTLPWNNVDLFEDMVRTRHRQIAGVVMEPINCNTGVMFPLPGYLESVREITEKFNIVLIFDEVISGFRVALDGAQGLLGVTPDLAIFAKALAAGFPLAAIVGKKDIMELLHTSGVMHGGTYNANVMSVAAGLACIERLEANGGQAYQTMNEMGAKLMDGLEKISKQFNRPMSIQGLGPIFHPLFEEVGDVVNYRQFQALDTTVKNHFYAKLQSLGTRVTARGSWFLSTSHSTDDIGETLEQVENTWRLISDGQ